MSNSDIKGTCKESLYLPVFAEEHIQYRCVFRKERGRGYEELQNRDFFVTGYDFYDSANAIIDVTSRHEGTEATEVTDTA